MKVVAFPFHDWRKAEVEGLRTRDLHILDHLSRHHSVESVLVVDRPTSFLERVVRRRGPFVAGEIVDERRLGRHRARLTRIRERLVVLDLTSPDLVGPLRGRGWWFDAFRDTRTLQLIEWAAAQAVGQSPVVIAWAPPAAPAITRLAASRFVYDSLDNWLIHPALRRHRAEAEQAYRELLPRADQVFVSAPASSAALRPFSDRIELLPNGVDVEAFEHAGSRPSDVPAGPIVGYVGKLAERIDVELIRTTAGQLPQVSFVFIGPVLSAAAIRPLRGLPNVHLLGERPYEQVPDYVQAFEVAWIPHRVGEGETGGDPIKLYEYLAAGRQVVTTPIDGLQRLAGQVHLVHGAEQAAVAIAGLLDGSIAHLSVELPTASTWRAITELIVEALNAHGA